MAIQERNDEMVNLLSADFQARAEPNFAWKSAVSAVMALPGLIAVWPTSFARLDSQTDRLRDVSGGGYHLTTVGNPYFRFDNLVPMTRFNGTNEYAFRTAGAASWASILGTEAYIHPSEQGLFMGGWFLFDDAIGATEIPMSKWGAAGVRSYRFRRQANGDAAFSVSNDGTAATTATVTGGFIDTGEWYFVAGRFNNTDNELKIWVNDETATAVYNNTVFDSAADFFIGARHGPTEYHDGGSSLCWLGACAPSDAIVNALREQTRVAFNV